MTFGDLFFLKFIFHLLLLKRFCLIVFDLDVFFFPIFPSPWGVPQVTEEQNCEEQVFPLAVNLLDRFLALEAPVLQRCQLQLLGCVCLLTASKLRQCRPIGVDLLVYYTDYSVTPAQIRVNIHFFSILNLNRRPPTCLKRTKGSLKRC